jgi:hypothetical protein
MLSVMTGCVHAKGICVLASGAQLRFHESTRVQVGMNEPVGNRETLEYVAIPRTAVLFYLFGHNVSYSRPALKPAR